jgi:hypothetical protein
LNSIEWKLSPSELLLYYSCLSVNLLIIDTDLPGLLLRDVFTLFRGLLEVLLPATPSSSQQLIKIPLSDYFLSDIFIIEIDVDLLPCGARKNLRVA